MEKVDAVLKLAEDNNLFFSMVEGALIKLECEIKKERSKYPSLFHTPIVEPMIQINISKNMIVISLGEIEYCVDIKKIKKRISSPKPYSLEGIEIVENVILDELEEVIKSYLI